MNKTELALFDPSDNPFDVGMFEIWVKELTKDKYYWNLFMYSLSHDEDVQNWWTFSRLCGEKGLTNKQASEWLSEIIGKYRSYRRWADDPDSRCGERDQATYSVEYGRGYFPMFIPGW